MFFEWKYMSNKSEQVNNGNLNNDIMVSYGKKPFTVLLVDDDPMFCRIVIRAAEKRGIKVLACQSVEALAPLDIKNFNVVVMDYNLGVDSPASGVELVDYFETVWGGLPVIMVSQTERSGQLSLWPKAVKSFVWKSLGAEKVLDLAFQYGS